MRKPESFRFQAGEWSCEIRTETRDGEIGPVGVLIFGRTGEDSQGLRQFPSDICAFLVGALKLEKAVLEYVDTLLKLKDHPDVEDGGPMQSRENPVER